MKTPKSKRNTFPRQTRAAFTFIELVVAITLSAILLRGMYTVFFAATDLARISEEKMLVVLEASSLSDYIQADVARSPYYSSDYRLAVTGDARSITFQATRLDGNMENFVYIEYSLSNPSGSYTNTAGERTGTSLIRTVWKTAAKAARTTDVVGGEGEDGTSTVLTQNVTSFEARYFDNTKTDIAADASWLPPTGSAGTLTGTARTRAIKFLFTLKSPGETLPDQIFTQILPVNYN